MSKQIERESMKAPAEENGRLLTDKDIRKCAWRWCMSVNGFNYETQLAPSVVFSEADALKRFIAMMTPHTGTPLQTRQSTST